MSKTYTLTEAADYLGRDKSSLDGYRMRNNFPEPCSKEMRRGRLVNVWSQKALDEWNPVAARPPKSDYAIYKAML